MILQSVRGSGLVFVLDGCPAEQLVFGHDPTVGDAESRNDYSSGHELD
jgi:hypothetical protein